MGSLSGGDLDARLAAAAQALLASRRVLVLCHREPDADTVGSALALVSALRTSGREAGSLAPGPFPANLDYLPGYDQAGTGLDDPDLIVCVDSSAPYRLEQLASWLDRGIPVIVIDHHITNTGFGTHQLIDASAAATAQVTARLLMAAGLPIDRDVATSLYAGLFRDTAGLRSESTTAETMRLAADLVAAGADPALAADRIFGQVSLRQLEVEAQVVATVRRECGGRLVWAQVTAEQAAGASESEVEAAVEQLARIQGSELAVLVHEVAPNSVEVHLRGRAPHDAAALATELGGGGHTRRAGARIHEPLDAARERVLAAARRAVNARPEARLA